MSTAEPSTSSPRRLSRLMHSKAPGADNQSNISLMSTNSLTDESAGSAGGLKASLDNAFGKVKRSIDERRGSEDAGVSPSRRLSTIFSKRRKDKGDTSSRRASRQLDPSETPPLHQSVSDLSATAGSRSSSLFTTDIPGEDSDVRPTLSAHSSHRGFLTLSSPVVSAETTTTTQTPSLEDSSTDLPVLPALTVIEPHQVAEPAKTDEPTTLQSRATFPPGHKKTDSVQSQTSTIGETAPVESIIARVASEPIETSHRPETPVQRIRISTTEPGTPPNISHTPQTFVTPPTPVLDQAATLDGGKRRSRALSNGASKLSRSIASPLSPTAEESKTPGGTIFQPNNASGFFTSIFTTAQKAADQLTSTIQSKDTKVATTIPPEKPSDAMRTTSTVIQTQEPAADAKTEEEAAARAVSAAYDSTANGRPSSLLSVDGTTNGGDQSPRHDDDALKRTGSVRSRLSGRRHRGSSAATGSAVVSALKEHASGLAHVGTSGPSHRVAGFAVASKKRNKDFHTLFRSVPEDDYLIEDYSAALQKEILLHGRLYVSEGHICFSSNILGWVTNLVMSFDEIVAVEKKSTAVIFPNALVIQTLQAKNTFASLVARDSTYELIIGIWKISHPHLKSSLNGAVLGDGTGDKTEKADSVGSDESDTESDDEFYDEDAADDTTRSYVEGDTTRSVAGSDVGDNTLNHKASGALATASPPEPTTKAKEVIVSAAGNSAAANVEGTGPETHAPTECGDSESHYDRPLTDTTIPAPLGKIYSLMWGPGSGAFMTKWLVDDQKSRELELKDDKIGLDNNHKELTLSYIKPLAGGLGPKQTKCITTNTLEEFDLERAVIVSCSTQTPDVPSGNVFLTKTRYCLMWGPNNSTRMIANCTIEWSGKSWIKGAIEKGAQDGQTQYVKDIVAALKVAVSPKTAIKAPTKKGKKRSKTDGDDDAAKVETPSKAAETPANWGPLEPVRGILEPVVGLVRPFLTSQVVISVLFVLLFYTWAFPPHRSGTLGGYHGYTSPERIAVYEDLWQREESELWDWLEDRVGLDDGYAAKLSGIKQQQKVIAARELGKRLDNDKMKGRKLDDAIRTTEQRLDALKEAVQQKKAKSSAQTS